MGNHFHKYYQLEHSFFKSNLDNEMLDRLWNKYWLATLSASPFLTNQMDISKSILDINSKVQQASASSGNAKKALASKQIQQTDNIRHPGMGMA